MPEVRPVMCFGLFVNRGVVCETRNPLLKQEGWPRAARSGWYQQREASFLEARAALLIQYGVIPGNPKGARLWRGSLVPPRPRCARPPLLLQEGISLAREFMPA